MNPDAKSLPHHAPRVADAMAAIDGVADRNGMKQLPRGVMRRLACLVDHPAQVGIANLMAGDADVDGDRVRPWLATGNTDPDTAQRLAGQLFRAGDRRSHGVFRRLHVDHGAGENTA